MSHGSAVEANNHFRASVCRQQHSGRNVLERMEQERGATTGSETVPTPDQQLHFTCVDAEQVAANIETGAGGVCVHVRENEEHCF